MEIIRDSRTNQMKRKQVILQCLAMPNPFDQPHRILTTNAAKAQGTSCKWGRKEYKNQRNWKFAVILFLLEMLGEPHLGILNNVAA